ncbi:MAG TPA: rhodanese-like domain-containing protein [bacterium]|nr:rhodanese-like domain-containing protein [bacterium]
MKWYESFRKMSLNHKLALALFLFGFIALFAGDPYGGARTEINTKEMALIVEKQVDHVSAVELADWIIKNRADYRLVDLRTEKEFAEYAIPTAENIPLTGLTDAGLQRNEKIILYSEGGIHSAQAWFLLKAKGYKSVYMLFGGLDEWKDQVLFPTQPENPSPEQLAVFAKAKEVSKYFGGTPQTGAESAVTRPQSAMPKLSLPTGGVGTQRPRAKKKEGC